MQGVSRARSGGLTNEFKTLVEVKHVAFFQRVIRERILVQVLASRYSLRRSVRRSTVIVW